LAARQRKLEAERLNEQLRKINMQLRQQARAGTLYAPGLSYAPVATSTMTVPSMESTKSSSVTSATATVTAVKPQRPSTLSTMDEEMTPEQASCRETMKEGKRLLRSGQGALSSPPKRITDTWLRHCSEFVL
jgi:hypothetical protein